METITIGLWSQQLLYWGREAGLCIVRYLETSLASTTTSICQRHLYINRKCPQTLPHVAGWGGGKVTHHPQSRTTARDLMQNRYVQLGCVAFPVGACSGVFVKCSQACKKQERQDVTIKKVT